MDVNKAKEAQKIMNEISRCEDFLKFLTGRSCNDEFEIYYRGGLTCELEEEALNLLTSHYGEKLSKLNNELKKL